MLNLVSYFVMKKLLLSISVLLFLLPAFAKHITGGEIIYDFVGVSGNSKTYKITLRLFRDAQNCTAANSCASLPASLVVGLFDSDNNQLVRYITVSQTEFTPTLPIVYTPPCIQNAPIFQYEAGYYSFDIDLPNNLNGYTITHQTCCRVDGIANGGSNQGATYSAQIPGNNILTNNITDNSSRFETGISTICYDKPFQLNFSAFDPDGDQLVYSFVNAYNGGAAVGSVYNTPAAPAYGSISYVNGYSGLQPLGPLATINSSTGIISGIAPPSGKYVVSVSVKSYRNGVFIADHRKDFIVTVAPCDFASSDLKTNYTFCDSLKVNFRNESTSLLNLTFNWNFGDPSTGALNSSTDEFPQHIYSAPGDYQLILIVNAGTPCAATDTAIVSVYPGFFPATDTVVTTCKGIPAQFNDITTTNFPPVNYWNWDFGDQTTNADTSRIKSPVYTYTTAGNYMAQLIVGTAKGCRDTLAVPVRIVDKPDFSISNDTLICVVDTLQLRSTATGGRVTWIPNFMINDTTSYNPLVSPDVTTRYTAFYENPVGCSTTASVLVKVVNEVTLLSANDTTICRTDSAKINLRTDALYFAWTPAATILDSIVQNPTVLPTDPITNYYVLASISKKCFKRDTVEVKTVPYPVPFVTGKDSICYGQNVQLNASGGSIYLWSPPAYLNNINIANPLATFPKQSLTYTVSVRDTLGCPKPVLKDFSVKVIRLFADAGPQDTSVVLTQPLQLNGTGSTFYSWDPATYLNDPSIAKPISLPQNNIKYTLTVSNSIGCTATDTINVKVFFLPPDLYVPSAFSPTGDKNNDLFRPICLGIKSLESFSIFNRWGVLLFRTSRIGDGWDGKFKGTNQDPGTFVWQANATDYKNKKIFRKGTVILIR